MARYQSPRRSDEEWFRLINECRRSGLSDSQWCKQHDIRDSTFFCAVKRLREKAMRFLIAKIQLMSFRAHSPDRMWFELI